MVDEFQVLWCQGQFALGEVKSKTRGSETQKKRVDVQWGALFRSQATGGRVHGASLFIGAQQWPRCEKQAMGPSQNKTKSPGLFLSELSFHQCSECWNQSKAHGQLAPTWSFRNGEGVS